MFHYFSLYIVNKKVIKYIYKFNILKRVNNKSMKKRINTKNSNSKIKYIYYIPLRYILGILLTILAIASIIAIVLIIALKIPYGYVLLILTEVFVLLHIIGSNENPDYKIPWILFVILLPVVGFMLYIMFHERRLPRRFVKRLNKYKNSLEHDDEHVHQELSKEDKLISMHAKELCYISDTHMYNNSSLKYYPDGKLMFKDMIEEIEKAEKFIFLEYFTIEEGIFWNTILEILERKVKEGVEVKVVYDDVGCMNSLSGLYFLKLRKKGIETVVFSIIKGTADGEFNNRSHRKILIVDGKVAFTGGINIADQYINEIELYGYWKDTGIRVIGEAVNEMTKLFLTDFYINIRKEAVDFKKYYIINNQTNVNAGYVIPFGDGPFPIYKYQVGKIVIINILNQAKDYVYITTPYLIIDNETMKAIENAALRGVDVRLIVPHTPDKKIIFEMTKSNYQILIKAGVKVYEYLPGFIHSKYYISDDVVGMIGTINLDYRSLAHHFENGVWIYKDDVILDIKDDFIKTMNESICMNKVVIKDSIVKKIIRTFVRIFSPML